MNLTVTQQKPTDKIWKDETGTTVPYGYTKSFERLNERQLASIAKEAIKINNSLADFKLKAFEVANNLYDAFIKENGGKKPGKGKGNMTLFNFDRSIKVEVSVHEQIVFDENFIQLAEDKLNELLNDGLSEAKEFIKPLVMDAFKNSGGKLDTKRVLGLRRYSDRISDVRYAEAMAFIDKAIRKPDSTEYLRIWVKDDSGKYQDVQLNFSSI